MDQPSSDRQVARSLAPIPLHRRIATIIPSCFVIGRSCTRPVRGFAEYLPGNGTNSHGVEFARTESAMLKLTVGLLSVLVFCVTATYGQSAHERIDRLHEQLVDVQSKQVDLQSRLDTLNEQLKPENIEKSLAGVGSTRPEDLRELRRRQIETEKSGIEQQLAVLNESRTKLEAGIAQAEALAYQQSALTVTSNDAVSKVTASDARPRRTTRKRARQRRNQ